MKFGHDILRGDAGIQDFGTAGPAHAAMWDNVADGNAKIGLHSRLEYPDRSAHLAGTHLDQQLGVAELRVEHGVLIHNVLSQLDRHLFAGHAAVAT